MIPGGGGGFRLGRSAALGAIRLYQLTLSGLVGRTCRHLPTCSDYGMEAIGRHGVWPGGWMIAARLCRCGPFGTAGLDFVPGLLPADASSLTPWRYGRWRGTNPVPTCEEVSPASRPLLPAEAGTQAGHGSRPSSG